MSSIAELQDLDFNDWFAEPPLPQQQTVLKPSVYDGAPAAKKGKGKPDKKQLNKEAADRYRKKRRQQYETLQVQTDGLSKENVELKAKCDKLDMEVAYLKELLMETVKASSNPIAALAANPSFGTSSEPVPSLEQALADPAVPSALAEVIKSLVEHRRAVTDARFIALEEKINSLTALL